LLVAATGGGGGWRGVVRCAAFLRLEQWGPPSPSQGGAFNAFTSPFFAEARRRARRFRGFGHWGTRDRARRDARQDDAAVAAARDLQLRVRREQDGLLGQARSRSDHRPRLRFGQSVRARGSGAV